LFNEYNPVLKSYNLTGSRICKRKDIFLAFSGGLPVLNIDLCVVASASKAKMSNWWLRH